MRTPRHDDVEQASRGTPFAVIGGVGVVVGALFLLGLLAAAIGYWLA